MNRSKTGFSRAIRLAGLSASLLFAGQSTLAASGEECGRGGSARLLIDGEEIWSGPGEEIATRFKMLTIPETSRATDGIPLADFLEMPLEQVASIKMIRCSGQIEVLEHRDFDRPYWKYYFSPNKRGFFKLIVQEGDRRARTSVKHISEIQVTSLPVQGAENR